MIVYPYAFKVYWCLMNNYKIKVNIEIVECEEPVFETPTRQDDGTFELNMSSSAAESIDDCEQFLLSTNYPALRAARAWAFRSGVKKKLLDQASGQALVEKPTPYRVDGEVGRFSFPIYALAEPEDSAASFPPNQLFPPQVGKTWYRTRGFKELTYVHGTPERSYRKTSSWLNRVRHQPEATSARTLQHNSEVEGQRILKHLQNKSQEILQEHQFSAEGLPLTPRSQDREPQGSLLKAELIEKALHSSQIPAALRSKMSANLVPYENPLLSVNISVDDVGVKEQKKQRLLEPEAESVSEKKPCHHTYQTVVHIENQFGSYAFNTFGVVAAWPILIAFLLHNKLLSGHLQFFVDGQRSLQKSILNGFSWFGSLQLILDWYHLEEKCKKQLSLALKGRLIRNQVLTQLLYWLWHGKRGQCHWVFRYSGLQAAQSSRSSGEIERLFCSEPILYPLLLR